MKLDYNKLKPFEDRRAWAYAESYDAVRIGIWNGVGFEFFDKTLDEPLDEESLLVLRVFDDKHEIKFSRDKCRDTVIYDDKEKYSYQDIKYYMYGTDQEPDNEHKGYTKFWEARGDKMYFPKLLDFPNKGFKLKLGIRNFIRYNPVPVCPSKEDYQYGLRTSGAGALEILDYAYTGFYYEDGKVVKP